MWYDVVAVPMLECTTAQPVCNGVKANSYEHHTAPQKRKPTNDETDATAISETSSNDATTTTSAAALLLSVAAVAVTAMSVF